MEQQCWKNYYLSKTPRTIRWQERIIAELKCYQTRLPIWRLHSAMIQVQLSNMAAMRQSGSRFHFGTTGLGRLARFTYIFYN